MNWLAVVIVWTAGVTVEWVDLQGPHATRDACRERLEQVFLIAQAQDPVWSAMGECRATFGP